MRRRTRPSSTTALSVLVPILVAAMLVTLVGGCQARRMPAVGTDVASGDVLHGRLVQGRRAQAFTFEGVESSMLNFTLRADAANQASPDVALIDPEGKAVDLAAHVRSPDGAATMVVEGVILLRTGTYQVTVTPESPCQPVYWRFEHCLDFPPMEGFKTTLTACSEHPIYVSAPRGGQIVVRVHPDQGSALEPYIKAVEDPWGGRALDPQRRPGWAPQPIVATAQNGAIFLNFVAPVPGRYKVVASARPGKEGPAVISTRVRLPPGPPRAVAHPNRPPADYGMTAAGSASDAGR